MEQKKQLYRGFPDPLASDEEKATNEYGLKAAKVISQEWFNGGFSTNKSCDFVNRRLKIQNNRLFTRGKQDTTVYKKLMEDLTYMNLDWTPLNIVGKFVDIVVNGIRDELYTVNVTAIDPISKLNMSEYEKKLRKAMRSRNMLEKFKNLFGVDLTPKGYVPADDEELEMHMGISYKPKAEIAEQLLINYVQKSNNFAIIKESVNRDIVENAIGGVRVYTSKDEGIIVKYVNVENLVHSFVRRPDFTDCHYYGEVETITLSQIKRESGYGDEVLRKIAETFGTQNGNVAFGIKDYESVEIFDIMDFRISTVRIAFRTTKTLTYKKRQTKYGFQMIERESTYSPPKRNDYKREQTSLDTWYEGTYILSSDYLYDYKESENLARDAQNKAIPPFVLFSSDIYENELTSFVDRTKPMVEQMNRIHLKVQQLIAQMRPDEVEIDVDMLAELVSKTGKKLTWEDALGMFNSKGIVFSTRVDMGDEGIKDRAALRGIPTQHSAKLEQLIRAYLHYYNMIRDMTGVNMTRDGSQPSDALVGTQQMQLLASNTATQGMVDASMEITRKCAETISTRLGDIFKFSEKLKEVYTNAVGTNNLQIIAALDDRHLHEFGFFVEMMPNETEMQSFKESLMMALQEGFIDVDDKIRAERVAKTSIKQAEMYLSYRRKQKMREKENSEMQKIQAQNQGQTQAQVEGEKMRQSSLQLASQLKIEEAKQLALIEVMKQAELNKVNRPEVDKGYEVDIFIEQLKAKSKMMDTVTKELKKDDRQDQVDSNQSRMIEQRKSDYSTPIDFKSDVDLNSGMEFMNN